MRVFKTKRALAEALEELMGERKFDKITTKMICEKSDVSRGAFYSHFDDKYDLLGYLVGIHVEGLFGKVESGSLYDFFCETLEKVRNDDRFLRNVLSIEVNYLLAEILTSRLEALLEPYFPREEDEELKKQAQFYLIYHTRGTMYAIFWWIMRGYPLAIEDMARYFANAFEEGLSLSLMRREAAE